MPDIYKPPRETKEILWRRGRACINTSPNNMKTKRKQRKMHPFQPCSSSSSISKTIQPFCFILRLIIISLALLSSKTAAFNVTTITFEQGYSPLFSDFNIHRAPGDKSFRLLLNRYSGSGIISSNYYHYGFFSASIKLPSNYTAGICVAFYRLSLKVALGKLHQASNVDVFERNHDELDIEFLGNVKGKPWRFQTNMYVNGSMNRGREERYRLWYDPSKEFHRYSISWTPKKIIFYVDEIPIREVERKEGMGSEYPSKPMSLYATIWDASNWATGGGKFKVDYLYEPFASEFKDLSLEGCRVDPIEQIPSTNCTDRHAQLQAKDFAEITQEGRRSMRWFREKYMYYSYCYDSLRYPTPPPECVVVPTEQEMFNNSGRLKEAMKYKFARRRRWQRGFGKKSRQSHKQD